MAKLNGKIIKVRQISSSGVEPGIGQRLRELRKLAGMTQVELAKRLAIGQTALSRLEKRDDIHISTLRNYIGALGATLRIDAAFDSNSPLMFNVCEAFDLDHNDENQLVLPILEDDKFRPLRDVVLSIKPQYSVPIVDGIKTVELRRRFPVSVPKGTLAYIYTTSPTRALTGVAEIKDVLKKPIDQIWDEYSDIAYIEKSDFEKYFSGLDAGFVIEFINARPLKRALSLSELRERFNFEPPQSFLYAKPLLREALKYESAALLN